MTWWQALILGIVEGLTEYLPVSSTGHLVVVQRLLGIGGSSPDAKIAADAYAICIQAGAIVAVLGLYWKHVKQMLAGLMGKDAAGLKLIINLVTGFIPAAAIGLLAQDWIKKNLFGGDRFGLWPIIVAWLVGGVAILVVANRRKGRHAASSDTDVKNDSDTDGNTKQDGAEGDGFGLGQLTWQLALIIGFAQCIAMWPGVSRSLVTIVAGLLVGMRLIAAVEFSFLLGVMTLGAATCYDGLKHGEMMLEHYGVIELGIGFLFAFVSAVIAVKWMIAFLQKHGLRVFGYYRIALAIAVAVLVLTKVIVM